MRDRKACVGGGGRGKGPVTATMAFFLSPCNVEARASWGGKVSKEDGQKIWRCVFLLKRFFFSMHTKFPYISRRRVILSSSRIVSVARDK